MPDEKSTSILDECWEWNGNRSPYGYGRKRIKTVLYQTHRLAWAWVNGPIPAGLCVLHRCDNPPCCNPRHLFLGTQVDNNNDTISKGRHGGSAKTHCPKGHEYSVENTSRSEHRLKSGAIGYGRHCIACSRARKR